MYDIGRGILRAPPFPAARLHEVPRWKAPAALSPSRDRVREICDALCTARVGGAFWSQPPGDRRADILLRPRAGSDLGALIDRESRGGEQPALLISVPHARSRRRFGIAADRTIIGDHDPWSLMERVERIVADPRDEVALLAAAQGGTVRDLRTGAIVDLDEARSNLVRALESFEYRDPFSGRSIDVLDWISLLGQWRAQIDDNRDIVAVSGIRGWKRAALSRLLWADRPVRTTRFPDLSKVPEGKSIALWPSRAPQGLATEAEKASIGIARIEDGFIRSIGLGAHLYRPCSIVVDKSGIYYDPSRPSDLETILAGTDFPQQMLVRAAALVASLVEGGITKYAAGSPKRIDLPRNVRTVLVPGQVEDDLSVQLGSTEVFGNLDLLRRVRLAEPDAWIAYRPHPDVAAGLRKGHVEKRDALRYADAVIGEGSMADLLGRFDCVHVLTSLAGFEALLRGREVVVHGHPFYAGWGLTRDLAPPLARRQRQLSLLELAAGALILYPRYLDPVTGLPCPPEVLVERHLSIPRPRPALLHRLRALQGRVHLVGRRLAGAIA